MAFRIENFSFDTSVEIWQTNSSEICRLALGGLAQCTNDPESDGTLALVQELSLNFRYPKRIPGGDHMEVRETDLYTQSPLYQFFLSLGP